MPSYMDEGTYNLRDVGLNKLVAKVHVEGPAGDVAGGRGYVIHYALVKAPVADNGWVVYEKPTAQIQKEFKWEYTGETFAQFTSWAQDINRRPKLRYVMQGVRENDNL